MTRGPRAAGTLRGPITLLAAGAGFILVALTFGASSLVVVGAGFIVIALLSPLTGLLLARSLHVRRELGSDRVQEGEPLVAEVDLERRPPLARRLTLREPLAGAPRQLRLPIGQSTTRIRLQTSFPRRGRHVVEPVSLQVSDPMALTTFTRADPAGPTEILVLPRIEPVQWVSRSGRGLLLGDPSAGLGDPPAALEVDGIRPYRPGTPASRIHWRSLARGAGLMERRLRADAEGLPLVALDPAEPGAMTHLDAAVRAAASITLALGRRRGCRLLIAGHPQPVLVSPELGTWPAAHAALALVEATRETRSGWLSAIPVATLLIVVCAARPAELPWENASGLRRMLVLPDELWPADAPGAALRVAGCTGLEAGAARVAA